MTATTEWVEDHFIAGDFALDFANTVFRRRPEPGADLFTDTTALNAWFARTGLLPTSEERGGGTTEADLADACALRALLWTVFDAQKDHQTIPSGAFTELLGTARHGMEDLSIHPDGTTTPLTAQGAFATVALRAITLIFNPPAQTIRACDRCGWFFIDSSRGRRRRWCSMKTCGNQAKAARYRSAKAQDG